MLGNIDWKDYSKKLDWKSLRNVIGSVSKNDWESLIKFNWKSLIKSSWKSLRNFLKGGCKFTGKVTPQKKRLISKWFHEVKAPTIQSRAWKFNSALIFIWKEMWSFAIVKVLNVFVIWRNIQNTTYLQFSCFECHFCLQKEVKKRVW